MKVKTTTLKDFEDCKRFEYNHTPDDWLKQSIRNGWVYVAERHDAVVGYARLEFIWMAVPYVSWIVVSEPHRGKGIGTAIVQRLSRDLTERGHTALYGSSEVMAPKSQAFHRHCGFQECGVIINHLRFPEANARVTSGGVGEVFFVKALGDAKASLPGDIGGLTLQRS